MKKKQKAPLFVFSGFDADELLRRNQRERHD